jgi:glycosyltransferase involved in cell wall biosynthesis
MKIAFLTPEYPHPKLKFSGGIGTSIYNLANGLINAGNEVVIVLYGQEKDDFFYENGISFYLVKNIKVKGLSLLLTQNKIQKLLTELIKENKIDIVEAVDWEGITSNIRVKCPIVLKLHGCDTYFCSLDHRPVKFFNRYRERKAFINATEIVSVSEFTAQLTNKLFEKSRYYTVIPNGIDIHNFDGTKIEGKTPVPIILYYGTLVRKKGLLELPIIFNEVHSKNKNAKLILVGKDSADVVTGNSSIWAMMQPLFTKEALQNVSYIGSVSYDKIKDFINRATVCVFPTFAEALPVSWIEAMAMNKAIVASNIGWASEVIEEGISGYLVHPKNHQEYASQILKLIENPNLRTQFGIAARDRVEKKFSMEVVAEESIAFYQKCIN